ncbi:MAG: hypothetical protein IKN16_08815 [Selenomonadaceae bacterium]|nr:hypothetical protein [Selenomonadaceae bacterium]
MSFKKLAACLTAAVMMLATLAVTFAQEMDGVNPDFIRGVIQVTGEGVGKSAYKNNPGKYRLTASKAARMDAHAKLVEYIKVQVETNASMTDYELDVYQVRTSAQGVIRNAREIGSPQYFDDGTCKVIMEMPLFGGKGSVAEVAFLPFKDEPKVSFPQPSMTVSQPSGNNYTGLIVDCRGKNLNPVMSPVIKNSNGQAIYGHQNLNYDKIIVSGMASYASDINDQISRSRAGNNPLVVKAESLSDINANPVVSVADADKILSANQHDKFLENCAVVFIN